ncbi:MAG: VOC family protein [Rhodothermaceae bacterium]
MANVVNWFEIPAKDLQRAKKFYSEVFDVEMSEHEMQGFKMAFFPMEENEIGGGLCEGEGYEPSKTGVKVYFNCGDDLSVQLSRVEAAGGEIVMPKTLITEEIGYMAFINDTEGNGVAFHSKG